nr:copper homeostasis membrane protein CopD [Brevundimonas basaltis]
MLRGLQYGAAVVLLGTPLFLLYGYSPGRGVAGPTGARRLIAGAALAVALFSLAGLVAQTAVMAGSLAEALKPASLGFMIGDTALGMAFVSRAAAALIVLILFSLVPSGRVLWGLAALGGLVVVASFAWTGHGASTEGPGRLIHLGADIVHAVAAALWLGALAGFALLLARPRAPAPTHRALRDFAGVGTLAVALLVATGLINSGYLIGPERLGSLFTSLYGQLLLLKLALFAAMIAIAAGNRWRLTPALGAALAAGGDTAPALARLRRSVLVEAAVGAAILLVVSLMGTLAPPAAL